MSWPNDARDVRDLVDGVSYEPGDVKTVHHFKVYDVPDMQDPHRKVRDVIRPRRVEIEVVNGVVLYVSIYGKPVKRDGSTGVKEKLRWFGRRPDATNPEPAWVLKLVLHQDLRWPGRTCVDAHVPAGSDRFA
jgi:hypothetical protein